MSVQVAKADGTTEPFDPQKLRASLHKAGASEGATGSIVDEITKSLYDGISTEEIYRRAFALLREHRRDTAAHYSLKRALLEFGPSGFPFEAYLSELFQAEGWNTKIDQIVPGACVEHEVDVVLTNPKETVYVEAKFHNTAAFKTDLKTVLYVKARIDDLRAAHPKHSIKGLVVTNTKFTSKAEQYATCEGLELLGWSYPNNGNLHERIEAHKLYPITALTTLSKHEKMALLGEKHMLCSGLLGHPDILESVGVRGKYIETVLHEAAALCASGKGLS
ncbi:MAG TPA: ATP cone domain-containing protein [Candidatus Paceibacterota bacterium]|nr:ATP cone domain-containing protein [Candidatus Paceibacterota bacterium]